METFELVDLIDRQNQSGQDYIEFLREKLSDPWGESRGEGRCCPLRFISFLKRRQRDKSQESER